MRDESKEECKYPIKERLLEFCRSVNADLDDKQVVVIRHPTGDLRARDLKMLLPETWLNDEVINAYMGLLNSTSCEETSIPKVHCFHLDHSVCCCTGGSTLRP